MFCSQCGAKAEGKFCSQCGAALTVPCPAAIPEAELIDWSNEIRYDVLMKVPEVREQLTRQAALAPKRLSAEDFMGICSKVFTPGIPVEKIAAVAQPIYASLGIQTGKHRTERINAPPGRTLVRALSSLARHGQNLRNVRQADDGCLIEASLPSDIWSMEGDLIVTVRKSGAKTEVDAVTKIAGQLYDWGKSRRCLDKLYDDLHRDAA